MPPSEFSDASAQDRRFFGALGGRVMTIVAITVVTWFLLVNQRDEAQRRLPTFTPAVHAARYKEEQAQLKADARASNGFLVAVAIAIGGIFLVYEGVAWGLGWSLGRLADAPRSGSHTSRA